MRRITIEDFEHLCCLQKAYKQEIGEDLPSQEDLERLRAAIEKEEILFLVMKSMVSLWRAALFPGCFRRFFMKRQAFLRISIFCRSIAIRGLHENW